MKEGETEEKQTDVCSYVCVCLGGVSFFFIHICFLSDFFSPSPPEIAVSCPHVHLKKKRERETQTQQTHKL